VVSVRLPPSEALQTGLVAMTAPTQQMDDRVQDKEWRWALHALLSGEHAGLA